MNKPEIELYAIRHAESVMNINSHLIGGRSNETPLTEKGIAQAKRLGRYLLGQNIIPDFAYVSPAVRTQQTAEYSLAEMGLDIELVTDETLQELDQGVWVGRERSEIYTEDILAEIERQGKDFKAEGGESMNDAGKRMLIGASAIADRHIIAGRPCKGFLYTHGGSIRYLASTIHDWPHKQTYEAETPNASISLFTRTAGKWELQYLGKQPEEKMPS